MSTRNTLDFYVIGAKKAGTTSLYYYFSRMTEVCVHDCKELSFLSPGFRESGTFERVVAVEYSKADPSKLWGAVTPHYLYDKRIPEKLGQFMPRGKFVAILRDPVDRAVSNFRMMVAQGHESRAIDEVINLQLEPDRLEKQRDSEFYHGADLDSYVAWGEYGRLLDAFLKCNRREHLLVCFLEELSANPRDEFKRICEFVGAEDYALPDNLGVRYNDSKRDKFIVQRLFGRARDNALLRSLGQMLVPVRARREIAYRYSLQTSGNTGAARLSAATESELGSHFEPDVRKLEGLIGRTVPWDRFANE